jgi:hypothetical protein
MLFAEDFAQVPTSLGHEEITHIQDDWLKDFQMLDLPQLFSFKDTPATNDLGEDLGDIAKIDLNTLENLLDVVPPAAQHKAPGPDRTPQTSKSPSKSTKQPKDSKKGNIISISREDLLKFSSEDLEAYVKALSATRPLTTAENKEIKRQRRLIKNRESAQQSRKRKKDKVGDLEQQVSELEAINGERMAKLDEMEAENVILKAEVSQLVSVIKDSPALSSLLMNVTSWMVMYTFAKAINMQGIQQTLIPPILQQKIQQFPATHAIC